MFLQKSIVVIICPFYLECFNYMNMRDCKAKHSTLNGFGHHLVYSKQLKAPKASYRGR